jgi:hypothetical protein
LFFFFFARFVFCFCFDFNETTIWEILVLLQRDVQLKKPLYRGISTFAFARSFQMWPAYHRFIRLLH